MSQPPFPLKPANELLTAQLNLLLQAVTEVVNQELKDIESKVKDLQDVISLVEKSKEP